MANTLFLLQTNFTVNPSLQNTFRLPQLRSFPIHNNAFKFNYSSSKVIKGNYPKLSVKCFSMSPKPKGENGIGGSGSGTTPLDDNQMKAVPISSGINVMFQRSINNVLNALHFPAITGVFLALLFLYDQCVAFAATGGRMGGSSFSSSSKTSNSSSSSSTRSSSSSSSTSRSSSSSYNTPSSSSSSSYKSPSSSSSSSYKSPSSSSSSSYKSPSSSSSYSSPKPSYSSSSSSSKSSQPSYSSSSSSSYTRPKSSSYSSSSSYEAPKSSSYEVPKSSSYEGPKSSSYSTPKSSYSSSWWGSSEPQQPSSPTTPKSSTTSSESPKKSSSTTPKSPEEPLEGNELKEAVLVEPAVAVKPVTGRDILFACGMIVLALGLLDVISSPETLFPKKTSVLKLQVGLSGKGKSLQRDLNRIAETADSSTPEGLAHILKETTQALLRYPDHCISGYSSVDAKKNILDVEKLFNQLSIEERSKFDEETLVNVNNIKKKSATTQTSNDITNEYIVVTIIVAAEGIHKLPPINSSTKLKEALQKLLTIPSSSVKAVDVMWTPQDENDILTEQEFREDYPLLR